MNTQLTPIQRKLVNDSLEALARTKAEVARIEAIMLALVASEVVSDAVLPPAEPDAFEADPDDGPDPEDPFDDDGYDGDDGDDGGEWDYQP